MSFDGLLKDVPRVLAGKSAFQVTETADSGCSARPCLEEPVFRPKEFDDDQLLAIGTTSQQQERESGRGDGIDPIRKVHPGSSFV